MKKILLMLLIIMLVNTSVFASTTIVNTLEKRAQEGIKVNELQEIQDKQLVIDSVRVGYKDEIFIITTPQGKIVGILNNGRDASLLKAYMDSMNIKKLDALIIPSIYELDIFIIENIFKELSFDKLYTNILYLKDTESDTKNSNKLINYFKDRIVFIEHNKKVKLEDEVEIEIISKKHKQYYHNSDYYEEVFYIYGTRIDYKDSEILFLNNFQGGEEAVKAIKKEKRLDCDLVMFRANERYSVIQENVNTFDEEMMKTLTPTHVIIQYMANSFKGYDSNTNETLNELTNIIRKDKAIPYYSYKFNSKTSIQCTGAEGSISINQEQIPRSILNY